jgi:hypothetical protein
MNQTLMGARTAMKSKSVRPEGIIQQCGGFNWNLPFVKFETQGCLNNIRISLEERGSEHRGIPEFIYCVCIC